MKHRILVHLQWLAALGLMFVIQVDAFAQGVDTEPNDQCLASQIIGDIEAPFVVNGSLDTPPEVPDIDFFQFSATPGLVLVAELKGQTTDVGTLRDPFLGLFDSVCGLLIVNDDFSSLDSHIDFVVPDDGVFILAASSCCDFEFDGVGGSAGTYELAIDAGSLPIRSIRVRIVDAASGEALSGDGPTFAFAQLFRCDDIGCTQTVSGAFADGDGRVVFERDISDAPLAIGTYQVAANAVDFDPVRSEPFTVTEGEAFDVGDIALTASPIVISDVQGCDELPPQGGTCHYSVTVSNNTSAELHGLAWSLVDGFGLGSALDFTTFEATAAPRSSFAVLRGRVNLPPLSSAFLPFQFDVRSFVRDGATFCTRLIFGFEPSPLVNTARESFLFCINKGVTGFRVMSASETQKAFNRLKRTNPFAPKVPNRDQNTTN